MLALRRSSGETSLTRFRSVSASTMFVWSLGHGRSCQCGVFDADLPTLHTQGVTSGQHLSLLTVAVALLLRCLREGMALGTRVFVEYEEGGVDHSF